jgi:hypothetical protein
MNASEQRLWEAKFELHLVQNYSPLCVLAGFDTAQFSGTVCYDCATRIMGALKSRARTIVKGQFSEVDYIGVLRSMTEHELAELRNRIR